MPDGGYTTPNPLPPAVLEYMAQTGAHLASPPTSLGAGTGSPITVFTFDNGAQMGVSGSGEAVALKNPTSAGPSVTAPSIPTVVANALPTIGQGAANILSSVGVRPGMVGSAGLSPRPVATPPRSAPVSTAPAPPPDLAPAPVPPATPPGIGQQVLNDYVTAHPGVSLVSPGVYVPAYTDELDPSKSTPEHVTYTFSNGKMIITDVQGGVLSYPTSDPAVAPRDVPLNPTEKKRVTVDAQGNQTASDNLGYDSEAAARQATNDGYDADIKRLQVQAVQSNMALAPMITAADAIKAKWDNYYKDQSNQLTARGQDVSARGQDLSYAANISSGTISQAQNLRQTWSPDGTMQNRNAIMRGLAGQAGVQWTDQTAPKVNPADEAFVNNPNLAADSGAAAITQAALHGISPFATGGQPQGLDEANAAIVKQQQAAADASVKAPAAAVK